MNLSLAMRRSALIGVTLFASACAHTPPEDPSDPFESANRIVYGFNTKADKYVLRPVAKTYVEVVPELARQGISNFLGNLFYPTVIINDLLQLKLVQTGKDLGRLFLNTTAGLGGLLDVATDAGLPANREDFGQTLGYWGVGPGWYLMLPLLGPVNNRDLIGRVGDYFTNPVSYAEDDIIYPVNIVNVIDIRAHLLGTDRFIEEQFDPYVAIRTAYLQQRLNKVHDGNPPKQVYDAYEE